MDLETENRIAAILLKEAAELRRQAQMEGALAYLRQPTVRSRPNSRFLTATVRGVQQANRAVEVNEMWRLREKQLELDDRLGGKKDESNSGRSFRDVCESHRRSNMDCNGDESKAVASHSSKKRNIQDPFPPEDEGLRDDKMEKFLHARSKRGRGAVGSRMDDTGPYLPSCPDSKRNPSASPDEELRKGRVCLGPDKILYLKYRESSDDKSLKEKTNKAKNTGRSKHSRKHKSKGKSKDKRKKRSEETKRRHQK